MELLTISRWTFTVYGIPLAAYAAFRLGRQGFVTCVVQASQGLPNFYSKTSFNRTPKKVRRPTPYVLVDAKRSWHCKGVNVRNHNCNAHKRMLNVNKHCPFISERVVLQVVSFDQR